MAITNFTANTTDAEILAEVEEAALNNIMKVFGRNALSVLINLAAKKLDNLDDRTPKYAILGSQFNTASTSFVDVTGLSFPVVDGGTYAFYFLCAISTNVTTEGFGQTLTVPTGQLGALSEIQIAAGAGGQHSFSIVTSGAQHLATGVVGTANDRNISRIEGLFRATANGNVQFRLRTETGGANSATIWPGSYVQYTRIS
jgi:hypothetical protein